MPQTNPFDDLDPESQNPFDDLDVESQDAESQGAVTQEQQKPRTLSEEVFQSLGMSREMSGYLAVGEAALGIGGAIAGPAVAGIAGLAQLPFRGVDKTVDSINSIQGAVTDTTMPKTETGRQTLGMVGHGMEAIAKAIKWPIGMLAQLPPEIREDFMNRPMGEFIGDKEFENTGSPGWATAARILPDAALAASAFKKFRLDLPKKTRIEQDIANIPEGFGGVGPDSVVPGRVIPETGPRMTPVPETGPGMKDIIPERSMSQHAEVSNAITSGNTKRLAEVIDPNPAMVAAFDELNIPHTPGAVSENVAFREQQASLKSQKHSGLVELDFATTKGLQSRAEELVEQFGGRTDRSLLDAGLRSEFETVIGGLEKAADKAFNVFNEGPHRAERIDTAQLNARLNKRVEELGGGDEGVKNLSQAEKELWGITHAKVRDPITNEISVVERQPTYATVESKRRKIGAQQKGQPIFKDADRAQMKILYGDLADAQQQAATRFGFGEEYKSANELVVKRKGLEKDAVVALGKEMGNGVINNISAASKDLTFGKVQKFNKLIAAIPKAYRAEVAMAVLSDMFSTGSQKSLAMTETFVKNWKALNTFSASKKALFDNLPPGAQRRFDLIGQAAEGFYRSVSRDNNSRTARDVIAKLDDGQIFSKIFEFGKDVVKAEVPGSMAGMPLLGTAAVVTKNVVKAKTPATQAADELLSSISLQQAVREYAAGRPSRVVEKTPEFQRWLKLTDERTKANIAKAGFVSWLIGEESGG